MTVTTARETGVIYEDRYGQVSFQEALAYVRTRATHQVNERDRAEEIMELSIWWVPNEGWAWFYRIGIKANPPEGFGPQGDGNRRGWAGFSRNEG